MSKESNLDRYFQATTWPELARCIGIINAEARETFQFSEATTSNREEFREVATAYILHHLKFIYGHDFPEGQTLAIAEILFEDSFPGGYESAIRIGCTAYHGGMMKILNHIRDTLAERHEQVFFDTELDKLVDSTDQQQILAVMHEYVRKHSAWKGVPFFPNGATLSKRYRQVLRAHSKSNESLSESVWLQLITPLSEGTRRQRFDRHWEK